MPRILDIVDQYLPHSTYVLYGDVLVNVDRSFAFGQLPDHEFQLTFGRENSDTYPDLLRSIAVPVLFTLLSDHLGTIMVDDGERDVHPIPELVRARFTNIFGLFETAETIPHPSALDRNELIPKAVFPIFIPYTIRARDLMQAIHMRTSTEPAGQSITNAAQWLVGQKIKVPDKLLLQIAHSHGLID